MLTIETTFADLLIPKEDDRHIPFRVRICIMYLKCVRAFLKYYNKELYNEIYEGENKCEPV